MDALTEMLAFSQDLPGPDPSSFIVAVPSALRPGALIKRAFYGVPLMGWQCLRSAVKHSMI